MDQLKHYGVPGMRWGIRKERELLGRKRRFHNTDSTSKRKGLSDRHKRILKVGAALAVAGLATYGLYKLNQSGKLDDIINRGKMKTESLLKKKPIDITKEFNSTPRSAKQLTTKITPRTMNGLRMLSKPESISETIKNVNPNRGNSKYDNNCTACSIATFLRQQGYDVTATHTGGKGRDFPSVLQSAFKNLRVISGEATKFGKSPEDASEMIVKRFGQNASGVCSIPIKNQNMSHAFNWITKDGVVKFYDGQKGLSDLVIRNKYWRQADNKREFTLARLDNAEINWKNIINNIEQLERKYA